MASGVTASEAVSESKTYPAVEKEVELNDFGKHSGDNIMKLEDGDMFEYINAHWIRDFLPSYEHICQAFIGHNGMGWPCPLPGLSEEKERDGMKFYQAHYSMARAAFKLHALSEAIEKSLGDVSDYQRFEQEQDRLITYAIGNLRDMFKLHGGFTASPSRSLWPTSILLRSKKPPSSRAETSYTHRRWAADDPENCGKGEGGQRMA